MQSKVLITEHRLPSVINTSELQITPITKVLSNDIYLSISRYSDTFMLIINQTNTMGSLYKGRFVGECLPELGEEQYEDDDNNMHESGHPKSQATHQPQKIYETKCLFGSTEIEFYQLLMRKILAVLFEQAKIDKGIKVLVNVSLPVKCKQWEDVQHKYYNVIVQKVREAVKEVN